MAKKTEEPSAAPKRAQIEPALSHCNLPHSWTVSDWPGYVYPNDPKRALYFLRTHSTELTAAGALVRIGRDRVVIGSAFSKWLSRQATRVTGYRIAANRARDNNAAAA